MDYYKFEVQSCLGKVLAQTSYRVQPEHVAKLKSGEWRLFDAENEYSADILDLLNYRQHQCDSCYNDAYNVVCKGRDTF